MRTGIYPGTFDPVTCGHMDIISRALQVVDRLIVGVAADTAKNCLFPLEERVAMTQEYVATLPEEQQRRIEVKGFSGLLVDYAQKQNAGLLIRGLRAVSDFEYEFQMACMNSRLNDAIETVFLTASETTQFVSSRFVKQICQLGGDISSFTLPTIQQRMLDFYDQKAA